MQVQLRLSRPHRGPDPSALFRVQDIAVTKHEAAMDFQIQGIEKPDAMVELFSRIGRVEGMTR